jgi:caffeoyl-CoA O-methyltransferase
MDCIHPLADKYAAQFTTNNNDLLQQILTDTIAAHPQSHMLSGHVQGQLLQFISKLIQPTTVLEIGTFTGYSALCLAEGLQPNGILHTIEMRQADAATAQAYFNKSTFAQQITLHVGDAKQIIPTLTEEWDLIFIDADKTGYIEYYELILPKLKPNGLIIADNVLFHGQVIGTDITGKNAKAIHAFNQHVLSDERTNQVLLTVRDGLLFIQKK